MPKDITLRHLEIKEELRAHRFDGRYYRVAQFSGLMHVLDEDAASQIADAKIRTFEIVEVRNSKHREEVDYFGIDTAQIGLIDALYGWSQNRIQETVLKEAKEAYRVGSEEGDRRLRLRIEVIKALPWYKRLFNQF